MLYNGKFKLCIKDNHMLASLVITEKHSQTMRYHFTSTKMAVLEKRDNNKCWHGNREIGTLIHCWWEDKILQPL